MDFYRFSFRNHLRSFKFQAGTKCRYYVSFICLINIPCQVDFQGDLSPQGLPLHFSPGIFSSSIRYIDSWPCFVLNNYINSRNHLESIPSNSFYLLLFQFKVLQLFSDASTSVWMEWLREGNERRRGYQFDLQGARKTLTNPAFH